MLGLATLESKESEPLSITTPVASSSQVTNPRAQAQVAISGLCMTPNSLSPPLETRNLLSPVSSSHELLNLPKPGTGETTLSVLSTLIFTSVPPKAATEILGKKGNSLHALTRMLFRHGPI